MLIVCSSAFRCKTMRFKVFVTLQIVDNIMTGTPETVEKFSFSRVTGRPGLKMSNVVSRGIDFMSEVKYLVCQYRK